MPSTAYTPTQPTFLSRLDGFVVLGPAKVSGTEAAVALAPVRLEGHTLSRREREGVSV